MQIERCLIVLKLVYKAISTEDIYYNFDKNMYESSCLMIFSDGSCGRILFNGHTLENLIINFRKSVDGFYKDN